MSDIIKYPTNPVAGIGTGRDGALRAAGADGGAVRVNSDDHSIDGEQVVMRRHVDFLEHNIRWRWLLDSYEGGIAIGTRSMVRIARGCLAAICFVIAASTQTRKPTRWSMAASPADSPRSMGSPTLSASDLTRACSAPMHRPRPRMMITNCGARGPPCRSSSPRRSRFTSARCMTRRSRGKVRRT